jgi:hypothetical protein
MHKVEPADREKEINKKMAGDPVEEFKRTFAEPCKNIDQLLDLVRKSVATGVGQDGRKLNPRQAQETELFIESMADTCKNNNQDTVKHFVEIGVDKDLQTCRVVNNYSHINFSFDPTTQMWLSKEGPTGPCGSISVATLERDKKSPFWLYTEKVIWTNPAGSLPNGLSCSQFHDRTLHYTWRAANNFSECTHIENGMN